MRILDLRERRHMIEDSDGLGDLRNMDIKDIREVLSDSDEVALRRTL